MESAIEPDRKEIKRRRPHEKTFRKVQNFDCKSNLNILFDSKRCANFCVRLRRMERLVI